MDESEKAAWGKAGELLGLLMKATRGIGLLWMRCEENRFLRIMWEVRVRDRKWATSETIDLLMLPDMDVEVFAEVLSRRWRSQLDDATDDHGEKEIMR